MTADSSLNVFFGEDTFLAGEAAKELVSQLLPGSERAIGLESLDGSVDSAAQVVAVVRQCVEALCTPPFLGGRKVVWLRDASFLAEGGAGRSAESKDRVAELASLLAKPLPSGVAFILTAPKIDKRSALYKTCAKVGTVREFAVAEKSYLQDRQAAEYARDVLAEQGLRAPEAAITALVERTGCDSRQIRNELLKLATYLGERKSLTLQDVEGLVSPSRGALPWDLPDAIGRRQLGDSIRVLRRLLFQKETPFRLLAAVEGRVRELIVYREAIDKGWLRGVRQHGDPSYEWGRVPPEADALLGQGLGRDPRATNPYRVKLLAAQAVLFTREELYSFLSMIAQASRRLVSSGISEALVLELLILQMLASRSSAEGDDGGSSGAARDGAAARH